MSLLDFFKKDTGKKLSSASLAKDRLQIIIAERKEGNEHPFENIEQLKADIVKVISKYTKTQNEDVVINISNPSDDISVMEMNIRLQP